MAHSIRWAMVSLKERRGEGGVVRKKGDGGKATGLCGELAGEGWCVAKRRAARRRGSQRGASEKKGDPLEP